MDTLPGGHSQRLRICEHRDAHLRVHHGKLNSISSALTKDHFDGRLIELAPMLLNEVQQQQIIDHCRHAGRPMARLSVRRGEPIAIGMGLTRMLMT